MAVPTEVERDEAQNRDDMHDTATSLGEKMNALGKGLNDAWEQAKGAVSDTADAARSTLDTTVHAVQDAVHGARDTVQNAVRDTGDAIGRAFDVREHIRHQPWVAVGAAVLAGVLVGHLTRPRR